MDVQNQEYWLSGSRDEDGQEGVSRLACPEGKACWPQIFRYEMIRDPEGVRASLRLRYLTYRYVNFIEENLDSLDIDAYDRYSTIFGAFNITGGRKVLIGSMRVIGVEENPELSPIIREISRSAFDPGIKTIGQRPKTFPIQESFDIPFLGSGAEGGPGPAGFYEISRLAVRPDYWMHHVDVGLHHLLILDSWMCRPPRKNFLISVHPRSRQRYEKVGFRVIPGMGEVLYKHINQLAIAMRIDLEEFLNEPRWYRSTCDSLFPGYREKGCFTRILTQPAPLGQQALKA
jgi:hypothetical protein